jgi:hypothetical protein
MRLKKKAVRVSKANSKKARKERREVSKKNRVKV